jgi:hypothetical protein
MKKHLFLQRLSFTVAPALALLLGGFTSQTQAAFDPTASGGNWDFYLTGDLKGVAQITFTGGGTGGTIDGIQIHLPGHVPPALEGNGRGTFDNPEDPRGTGGATNGIFLHYGGAIVSGSWGYDSKGKIVGSMVLTSTGSTNGVSFRGSGVTDKRMTLRATRDDSGAVSVYHGVPRAPMTDISGDFFISGKKTIKFTTTSSSFTEILNLAAGGPVNQYDVMRHGPGYDSTGLNFAILTSNKRLGIYGEHFVPGTSNLIVTALSGSFNTNKLGGKLSGFDGTNFLSLKIGASMAPP